MVLSGRKGRGVALAVVCGLGVLALPIGVSYGGEYENPASVYDLILNALQILWVAAGIVTLFLTARPDPAAQQQVLFYPVSLKKYWIMSLCTFGLYQYYWIYKTWQWLRDVGGQDIWPFPRALFASFTNFSLFPQIASHDRADPPRIGNARLSAVIFLLVSLFHVAVARVGGMEVYGLLAAVITTAITGSYVRLVAQLNEERGVPHLVDGRFTWRSYLAMSYVLGALAFLVVLEMLDILYPPHY